MARTSITLAFRIVLGVPLFAAVPVLAQSGLRGNWQGGWTRDGATLPVTFVFQQIDSAITGSFGSDQLRVIGIPVSKISYRPPAVHFEIVGDATTAVFDGEMKGNSIRGRFKDGNAAGQFVLRRTSQTATDPYRTEEIAFQNGDVKLGVVTPLASSPTFSPATALRPSSSTSEASGRQPAIGVSRRSAIWRTMQSRASSF